MDSILVVIAGISLVVSPFMIAIGSKVVRRFKSTIFKLLLASFIIIFLTALYVIISIFVAPQLEPYLIVIYSISELILLLLFYGATVKGR